MVPMFLYYYIWFRRIFKTLKFPIEKKYFQVLIIVIAFLFVWPIRNLFGIWTVIVGYLLAFIMICDIFYVLIKKRNHPIFIDRIYSLGIIPVVCVMIVIGYSYIHMQDVKHVEYQIQTNKSISQNYRVALISDLHYPNTMDFSKLSTYCDKISKEDVDLVILAGDIVDEKTSKQEMQEAFMALGNIRSRLGIYYVYGNHDQALYSFPSPFTVEELEQSILDQNITILSDSVQQLTDDLTIIGRQDRSIVQNNVRLSSKELLANVDQDDFLLIVDHQPKDLAINDQNGYDLQVSGHTHGGQMFPVGLMTDLLGFGEMNYGYRQMEHLQVIVTSGIAGWGYPLRLGSQSEYVIINIIGK